MSEDMYYSVTFGYAIGLQGLINVSSNSNETVAEKATFVYEDGVEKADWRAGCLAKRFPADFVYSNPAFRDSILMATEVQE
jgi:hypothetical protein